MPTDPFADGLTFEGELPLTWQPLPGPPTAADLHRFNDGNEPLLRALTALMDSHPPGHSEESEYPQELTRLEAKLDLLLDMVGRALALQGETPAMLPLRLSARGIEWPAAARPTSGSWVLVRLYLHPRYLQPLELVGQAVPEGESHEGVVVIAFHGMQEVVRDCIDKFIFRHHRRVIASQRAPEA